MKRNANVCGVVLTLFCSAILLAQSPAPAKDPRIGTWKVNLAKSTYAQGTAPPQMSIRTYLIRPDGFNVLNQANISAQGNATFAQATYKIDGKAYAQYSQTNLAEFSVTGAKPGTNSYRLLNPNTVEVTARDNMGNVTSITANVVSADGKTITATAKDATGKVTNVIVWDKQ